MLFKDHHIPMIRSGSKTVTRREWAENYSRPNEGTVQIASDEMFTSDDEADCCASSRARARSARACCSASAASSSVTARKARVTE